jgi:hypothetical protein
LATNDHISSNWISRVSGGKSHEFVVGGSGVPTFEASQPHDGVAVDSDEAFSLADPIAFGQVLQDGDRLLLWQARVEQGRALAFGETGLAGLAVKESDLLMFAVAIADREIAGVALAVDRAVVVLAAEAREVVHGCGSSRIMVSRRIIGRKSQDKPRLGKPQ